MWPLLVSIAHGNAVNGNVLLSVLQPARLERCHNGSLLPLFRLIKMRLRLVGL